MARPAECRCVHYLFLAWLLFLTAGQVVFLTLHYTAGVHNRSQGVVTPQSTREIKHNLKPQVKEKIAEIFSGKMINLEASKVDGEGRIQWRTRRPEPSLLTLAGEVVTLGQDAYYFLCLTVTLNNVGGAAGVMVTLKRNNHVIMEGRVDAATFSTGPLVRVEDMSAGDKLVVTVTALGRVDGTSPGKTNLGIICLPKPQPSLPAPPQPPPPGKEQRG
ncbi:uncharacterized protein LOC115529852 [Gadus morhua]|uniref:uncharacterized protein LOC115529852 n=1 Tax=Gadus morhua TaxID=8049 RepID=UPI0011B5201C|nr:uncharacterized protein LOC115529852 [Gadus morhua]